MIRVFNHNFKSLSNLAYGLGVSTRSKSGIISYYGSYENFFRKQCPGLSDEKILKKLLIIDKKVHFKDQSKNAFINDLRVFMIKHINDFSTEESKEIAKKLTESNNFTIELKKYLNIK